jgi:benzoylformate decarboxylase
MSGKRAFLELLRQEGVEYIFGNPGTTELPLLDGLVATPGLRYVLGLQEAAVLAMADGYAQASGKLAVANVHVAPGLGNALGMLYDAQKAGAPLLVTAGQHDQSFNFTEPILWADLPPIARPFVKWAAEVRRLADLPRAVHRAAKTAGAAHRSRLPLAPDRRANAEGRWAQRPTASPPPARRPGGGQAAADLLARASGR